MTTYCDTDKPENLSIEQLGLMVRFEHDWLVKYLEENTIFDAHRVRLLLELGQIKAQEQLSAKTESLHKILLLNETREAQEKDL